MDGDLVLGRRRGSQVQPVGDLFFQAGVATGEADGGQAGLVGAGGGVAQGVGQGLGGGEAPGRVFGQRFQDEVGHERRQIGAVAAGRWGWLLGVVADGVGEGFGREGACAGAQFVEDYAQGVDFAAGVGGLPQGLFGRHVGGGADGEAGGGDPFAQQFGQAEVGEDGLEGEAGARLRPDEDVGRLDVAVEDAAAVGVVEGLGQFTDDQQGFG